MAEGNSFSELACSMVQKMMPASGYWERAIAPSKIYGTKLKNLLMQRGSSNRITGTENDKV